jgi:aminoglycoside phosphotransferase (APT) family kinase protein
MAGAEADLAWWRFMDGPSAELDGIGGPDELVETWERHSGRKVQHLDWHDVFTTFRLGIIMIRLFSNMAADGHMDPADAVKQGWESAPVQSLAAQLELLG